MASMAIICTNQAQFQKNMARPMKHHPISLPCLALLLIAFSMTKFRITESAGFTIDLIHRDSFQSPSLYSSSERVKNALQRSFNCVKSLLHDHTSQSPSTEIVPDRGEYLMKISLGTPGFETLAIADTGSDLTWIQCKPCTKCFKQKSPIFDPQGSSTYKAVPCNSVECDALPTTSCDGSKDTCVYTIMYGDSSFSKGDIAVETVTLGSTSSENVSIANVTIGCGHLDQGTFGAGSSGIVGLGGGKASLITQMGGLIEGRFSYCLVPFLGESSGPSKMNFGENAIVSGASVVSTPLVPKSPTTFYFLTLEGMSVGKQRLDIVSEDDDDGFRSSQEGNIIIDSGTTLTFLPEGLYYQVITAVRSQMTLREVSDPQGLLKLCYLWRSDGIPKVPEITAHFRGADVKLKYINTFVKTGRMSLCLAFAPANRYAIYGNLAQMNFLVGYDLEKRTVSFKPSVCSKA
ncbi:hypothetical protein OROHE_000938 [Orobanche hederae]